MSWLGPFFRRLAGDNRVNACATSLAASRQAPAIVTHMYYNHSMTQTISFRPDERTIQELRALTRGRKTSEVLRELIHKCYIEDLYARAVVDAERLRGDSEDRAELAAIAQEMDEIRAW